MRNHEKHYYSIGANVFRSTASVSAFSLKKKKKISWPSLVKLKYTGLVKRADGEMVPGLCNREQEISRQIHFFSTHFCWTFFCH